LDQANADVFGFCGHPVVQTPRIDMLAARGARFGRCFAQSPICMPARTSLMTGLYPFEHGLMFNEGAPDPALPSHVRSIRDEGYLTALIGKAHLTVPAGHSRSWRDDLTAWGFVSSCDTGGLNWAAKHGSRFTADLHARGHYEAFVAYMENYRAHCKWNAEWETPPWDDAPYRLGRRDDLDRWIGHEATLWLRDQPPGEPFYLQVNFGGPHPPWNASRAERERYDLWDPALPLPSLTLPAEPHSEPTLRNLLEVAGPMDEEQLRLTLQLYMAKLTVIDEAVGEVLDALEACGHADHTWVVLHGDHGEMLGHQGMLSKLAFFDPSARVPLVVVPPGGVEGWDVPGLVDQLDVTRTLLDIAGAPSTGWRGRSLVDQVLAGVDGPEATDGKAHVISEILDHAMIRTDEHKVVVDSLTRTVLEVYDLVEDPGESVNLVGDPSVSLVEEDLLGLLVSTWS
jgi:choline-sulfatase